MNKQTTNQKLCVGGVYQTPQGWIANICSSTTHENYGEARGRTETEATARAMTFIDKSPLTTESLNQAKLNGYMVLSKTEIEQMLDFLSDEKDDSRCIILRTELTADEDGHIQTAASGWGRRVGEGAIRLLAYPEISREALPASTLPQGQGA